MRSQDNPAEYRDLVDSKLTELVLYAKKLSPEARIEANTIRYEDEDGRVEVFPPAGLSEAEEERIEQALAERSAEILSQTGLFIPCAMLDATVSTAIKPR